MFGGIEEIFAPSQKHTEDERERLEHTRVVEGDHGPGRGPIDLDSGLALMLFPAAVLPAVPRLEEEDDEDGDGADPLP